MPLSIPFIVVLRIPKKMLFFEYQLAQLARLLPEGATVLAAGMDKHLSPHSANILERIIGPTLRHPGQRKARLFSAVRDDRPATDANGIGTYYYEPLGAKLQGLPNVFSSEKLDLGTLFLLEHLRQLTPVETVFDLACGNGVLGLVAVKWGLTQKVVFCDESAMAIASTQLNANSIFPEKAHKFSFHHGDGLQGYRGKAAQLILCNPPFHLDHTVDEFAGRHLLEQCYIHLAPGGQLCLVANKHLNYQPALRRRFHRDENIANNAKFNILFAEKA